MAEPRNGYDGRLMAKILLITIQVPDPSEMWRRLVVIKTFAINYYHRKFLYAPWIHIFFVKAFLEATYSLAF